MPITLSWDSRYHQGKKNLGRSMTMDISGNAVLMCGITSMKADGNSLGRGSTIQFLKCHLINTEMESVDEEWRDHHIFSVSYLSFHGLFQEVSNLLGKVLPKKGKILIWTVGLCYIAEL